MADLTESLVVGLVTGGVMSSLLGFLFHRRTAKITEDMKNHYQKSLTIFQSNRVWRERAISELLGPMYMQFDRTKRAFQRWQSRNLFLEQKVIRDGNSTIRDLLLSKGHLIPPHLLDDAGKLVEHYDRWLEEFEKVRNAKNPDLETPFVFVGPQGFPFPDESEDRFKDEFRKMWAELYLPDRD